MVRGRPGPAAQAAERELFTRLIARGISNAEACRIVGVNPRTGKRWRHGRTVTSGSGRRLHYPPVISTPELEISSRYLSEDERVTLADLRRRGQDAADNETETEASEMEAPLAVYGNAAYGARVLLEKLEAAGADIMTKVQPPVAPGGRFPKDAFTIDPGAGTVTCPAHVSVPIKPAKAGGGTAAFGTACAGCPLAAQCTTAKTGRTISIGRYEAELTRARATQQDPAWRAEYRATRPKVERKLGHLMRCRHGGRRARVRGQTKVAADFSLLAAATNLARFGVLGLTSVAGPGWAVAPS